MALTGLTWLTAADLAFLILSIFIMPKTSRVRGTKKRRKYAGKNVELSSMKTEMPY